MSKPKLLRIFDETTKDTAYSKLNNPVNVTQSGTSLLVDPSVSVVGSTMLTFTAPCNCSAVSSITVDGVSYNLVDTNGVKPSGSWTTGAVVSIILDCSTNRAYIQSPTKVLTLDSDGVLSL